jgi:hypothetical protein
MLALPQSRKGASFTNKPRKLLLRSKRLMTKWLVAVQEVQGFLGPIAAFFGKLFQAPSGDGAPAQGKPAAKAKPVAKKAKKAYVDETKVMADVVKQLTEFFKLQEQLLHI